MKKLIALTTSVLLACSLTACGGGTGDDAACDLLNSKGKELEAKGLQNDPIKLLSELGPVFSQAAGKATSKDLKEALTSLEMLMKNPIKAAEKGDDPMKHFGTISKYCKGLKLD